MKLDTPTIIVLTIINVLTMLMILVHTRVTRKTYPGFDVWLAGTALWFVGAVFNFLLRGIVSPFWVIVIGNGLMQMLPILFLDGINRFYAVPGRWWRTPLNLVLLAISLVPLYYFSSITENISARSVVISICYAVLYSRAAIEPLLVPQARRHSMQWLLSACFLPMIILYALRIPFYLAHPELHTFAELIVRDRLLLTVMLLGNFIIIVINYSYLSLTSDRLEEELREAQHAVEEANRAKSAFLGMVSHEMRTPLAIIAGVGEILSKRLGEQDRRDVLPLLQQATGQLRRHIDDLLDLTKIESGAISFEQRTFNLPELLDEIRAIFILRITAKGLLYQSERSANLPVMMSGDRQRIFQIIANLFENALKSTDHGSVAASAERQGTELVIAVTDSGSGINAEQLAKIFDPFTSFSTSGGTGLGLPISRRLAEAMGGTLTATSTPGQGSRFTLILPCCVQNTTETPAQNDMPDTLVWVKPLQVLAVDDLPENLRLLTLLLADTPIILTTVETGTHALQRITQGCFDVLLTDMRMAEMDGITLTKMIRADEQCSGRQPMRIIALSANAYPEDRQAALEAGCDSYLSRPFTTASLLQEMMSVSDTVKEPKNDGHTAQAALEQQFDQLRKAAAARIVASITTIEQALIRGDSVIVREEGHRIKGLGMSLGIPDAESVGTAIEQAGLDARLETVPELLDSLRRKSV